MSDSTLFAPASFAGKTVVITGASSGIGAACAIALGRVGARVLLSGRDMARLASVAEQVPGGEVVTAALEQAGAARELVDRLLAFGTIDGAVNCAGFGLVRSSHRLSEQDIDRHFAVNVRASMLLAIHLGEHMKSRGAGAIVNLSSVQGAVGTPHQIAYAASKGAVDAMTRALARELGPHGVRVNAIAPGLVATEMWGAALDDEAFVAATARSAALRRWATPEMIADVALFLLSDAAAYITGEVVNADGGFIKTGNLVPESEFDRK